MLIRTPPAQSRSFVYYCHFFFLSLSFVFQERVTCALNDQTIEEERERGKEEEEN